MSAFTDTKEGQWRRKEASLKALQRRSATIRDYAGSLVHDRFPAVLVWAPLCAVATFFVFRSGLYQRLCPEPVVIFGYTIFSGMLAWQDFLVCRPYAALIGNLQGYMDFADVIYGILTASLLIGLHQVGSLGNTARGGSEPAESGGQAATDVGQGEPARFQKPFLNALVSLVLCLIICYTSRVKMFDFQVAGVQLSKIAPGSDSPDSWILAFLLGFFVTQVARRISATFMVMALNGPAGSRAADTK
jgi:hypothetical protein